MAAPLIRQPPINQIRPVARIAPQPRAQLLETRQLPAPFEIEKRTARELQQGEHFRHRVAARTHATPPRHPSCTGAVASSIHGNTSISATFSARASRGRSVVVEPMCAFAMQDNGGALTRALRPN